MHEPHHITISPSCRQGVDYFKIECYRNRDGAYIAEGLYPKRGAQLAGFLHAAEDFQEEQEFKVDFERGHWTCTDTYHFPVDAGV